MRKLILLGFALILIGAGCGKQTALPTDTASPASPTKTQTLGKKHDLSQLESLCVFLPKNDVQAVAGITILKVDSYPRSCAYWATDPSLPSSLPVIRLNADQTVKYEADDFDYDIEAAPGFGLKLVEVSNLGERALYSDVDSNKNISPHLQWIKNETKFWLGSWGEIENYGFDTEQKRKEILIKLAKIVDQNW